MDAVRWIELPSHGDARGTLTSIESRQDIPFAIRRVFYMHGMTQNRGGHAHIDTDQIIIAAAGRFSLQLSHPQGGSDHYLLDNPCRGLYLPRLTFLDITDISPDAVCLVLSSTHYDMGRSLRSRADWLRHLGRDA